MSTEEERPRKRRKEPRPENIRKGPRHVELRQARLPPPARSWVNQMFVY